MGDLVHVMKVTNEIFKRHIPSVDVRQTRVAQKIIKKSGYRDGVAEVDKLQRD